MLRYALTEPLLKDPIFGITICLTVKMQIILILGVLLLTFSTLSLAAIFRAIRTRNRPGLRDIPGPWLASFSYLDRLWSCIAGLQMEYHLKLHDIYGPLVRVGPKHVSFSQPSIIPQVYGIGTGFVKSDFYKPFDFHGSQGRLSTIFSVRDEKAHRVVKRPVANAYSIASLKELEPMNDDCSEILIRKLARIADTGDSVDLGKWLHWYAFDVIMSITFSNRLGFMEQEKDIGGIMHAIDGRLVYSSIVGQAPQLHEFLLGSPIVRRLVKYIPKVRDLNAASKIMDFAASQLRRCDSI
jgi:hypothetical protein